VSWNSFSSPLMMTLECQNVCSWIFLSCTHFKLELQSYNVSQEGHLITSYVKATVKLSLLVRLARSPSFKMTFPIYLNLLKTEQQISDIQHFHWLAQHRLSVHIPAVHNMVKEFISNKASWKHCCISKKKQLTKAVLDQNKINRVELLILELLIKQ